MPPHKASFFLCLKLHAYASIICVFFSGNFVDYKGCVEKDELIQRVERLYKENEANKKVAAQIEDAGRWCENFHLTENFKRSTFFHNIAWALILFNHLLYPALTRTQC